MGRYKGYHSIWRGFIDVCQPSLGRVGMNRQAATRVSTHRERVMVDLRVGGFNSSGIYTYGRQPSLLIEEQLHRLDDTIEAKGCMH